MTQKVLFVAKSIPILEHMYRYVRDVCFNENNRVKVTICINAYVYVGFLYMYTSSRKTAYLR